MTRFSLSGIAATILLVLTSTQAQAIIVYANNGSGSFNAYELVTATQNWAGAKTNSQIAFPGGAGVPASGTIGHLGTISNATENVVYTRLTSGDPWIGLTDKAGDAPGAFEGGNQTGFPVPANGSTPVAGQRGFGWAWVTGEPLVFHNWNGAGEPNGGAGESHVQLTGSATWNDLNESSVRNYIREWDLNLSAPPTPSPAPLTPGFVVTDLRNVGAVNNGNYKTIAAAPPAGTVFAFTIDPVINYGGGANGNFPGDLPFPQGGGDNFVTIHNGFITIPQAGPWTFVMNQDDPIFISIGTNGAPATFEDLGCCNTTFATLNLDAGTFPIQVIFGEFGGGEHIDLGAAFGAGVTNLASFRLLGDTANGGLRVVAAILPEPATAMLGVLGMSVLAMRRRRVA